MAATANAVRANRFLERTGIVFSRMFCFAQVSQVMAALASMRLFRLPKQHCCLT
jgi:hypothetical protein